MSNPVPPAGDGFPPPAHPGSGGAPAGQGFGGAPADQGFGGAPAPRKKSVAGRVLLGVAGAAVVFVLAFLAREAFFGDRARDAAVGDCITSSEDVQVEQETAARAEVVACDSADAAYTVVGRVDGETDTKSKSCEKFFEQSEAYYVYGSTAGGGYLLCLRPKAA